MRQNGNGRKKPRRIPEVLTEQERARFLAQLEPADTPSKLRNRVLVRFLLDAGLRASELINIRHRDFDLDSGRLWVRQGKGKKDRGLWINGAALVALQAWLTYKGVKLQCGANFFPSAYLFTALDGIKPICGRWMRKMVKRLGEKAGLEKNCHPHLFRHCFGTTMLQYTKNLFLVSKALGHANLSTTEIYLHLVDGELEAAMKGMNNENGGPT